MGICPSGRKGRGFSSVLCEVSHNLDKEKEVVKSGFFFLYIHSEDVVSSMPAENNTGFENSGFELVSSKWENEPQET